mmetsp:Transcript_7636/g.21510  ORF Transcript_7636/g.21510 Transcript_7636/m.21510 type:complete len:280 (+) Transcript_7636:69-908(+)
MEAHPANGDPRAMRVRAGSGGLNSWMELTSTLDRGSDEECSQHLATIIGMVLRTPEVQKSMVSIIRDAVSEACKAQLKGAFHREEDLLSQVSDLRESMSAVMKLLKAHPASAGHTSKGAPPAVASCNSNGAQKQPDPPLQPAKSDNDRHGQASERSKQRAVTAPGRRYVSMEDIAKAQNDSIICKAGLDRASARSHTASAKVAAGDDVSMDAKAASSSNGRYHSKGSKDAPPVPNHASSDDPDPVVPRLTPVNEGQVSKHGRFDVSSRVRQFLSLGSRS